MEANETCEMRPECPVSEALSINEETNVQETLFILNGFDNVTTRQDIEQSTETDVGTPASCSDIQSDLENLSLNVNEMSLDKALHSSGSASEITKTQDAHLAIMSATAVKVREKPPVPIKPNVAAMLLGEASAALETGIVGSTREKGHVANISVIASKDRKKPVVPPKPKINL
jgi:hypothetical protein